MMDTSQNDIGGDDILLTYLGPITIEVLGDFDVTGTISMQGRTVRSGVPLTLTDVNGAPVYGPFTDDSGPELAFNVLFSPVNGGIYEITTLQPRYLNVTADLNKQFLVNSAYEIEPLELQGGNAIWTDNDIDINDASLVGAQYGWTGNTSTQDADVNFDDKVNIQDLALVGGNFDLDSATAYADWLLPEYSGYVEGVLNTSETGAISGSVAGDYNLTITGQLTEDYGTSIPNVAFFDGYVTGDFEGTITGGKVSNMGVDPLYAVIDVPGMTETVRIVGNFVKSGIGGHFKGQIITGDELDPVTSLTITGGDTVNVGDVLDLDVTILPATATDDVRWSIYINTEGPNPGDATINELTGELTGVAPGNVTVVVITVDDSGMSWTNKQITVTTP
jgi:hypothetical protein